MNKVDTLRNLLETFPYGTHYCSLTKASGFALNAEYMLEILDHYDQLKKENAILSKHVIYSRMSEEDRATLENVRSTK